jgi:hypothetical protein
VVWAALIIGLCSGVVFIGSGLSWRLGRSVERFRRLRPSLPDEERPSLARSRELSERLGTFSDLRDELLQRARRAKASNDLDAELDAFREASDQFLQLAGHDVGDEKP